MDARLREFATSLLDDDKKRRLKRVRQLREFVATTSPSFEHKDYFKLWESLYFAVWSADGPSFQRSIGVDFCELIHHVPYERVEVWFDAFWFVMQREWDKLDRYRVDKFYLLIRMFVAQSMSWLKEQKWKDEALEKVTTSWSYGPLRPRKAGQGFSGGVGYHLAEIIAEEVAIARQEDLTFTGGVYVKLLQPFLAAFCTTDDGLLADRIKNKILAKLDITVPGGLEAVAEELFEQAAQASTGSQLRTERVYSAIHVIDKALEKQNRKANYEAVLERIKESLPKVKEDDSMGLTVEDMKKLSCKHKKKAITKIRDRKTKRLEKNKTQLKIFKTRRRKVAKRVRVPVVS